ncbi:TlpA family protein disulfide reductase [Halobiforma nitratireducens]|uniref:Thioredoxin n=1 Tax=Halobiforma nitratireducens JCM 10879 TaxID=1227454 RepID=M0L4I1_9EURY|nr:TlpA disulfide reductase family protein [Halobiforma nitratireducens]EMA27344.1 thioredoxin [Halobiforma nitratireducens JCM 10879]
MKRRDLLAGAAAVGVAGAGAVFATGGFGSSVEGVEPFELETIDAPGSEAGTLAVPEPGRVTFLELFATWCDACARTVATKGEVYDELGERDDLQFVSVSNEPLGHTVTRDDVADWWDEHDGRWTVAIDDDLALTETLDASGVPYSFVLDAENRVTWSRQGDVAADELRDAITSALESETDENGEN